MMNRKQLDLVLEKNGLLQAVPPEVRRHIIKAQVPMFRRVYRKTGHYSAVFAALAAVFFFTKKLGLSLGFTQSLIAFFTAAALSATAISFGAYTAVRAVQVRVQKRELLPPSPLDNRQGLTRPAMPRPRFAAAIAPGAGPIVPGSAPSLHLGPSSIALMGPGPETGRSLHRALERSLINHYPGPVEPAATASLILRGSLVRAETGHALYLRLVRLDGSIMTSLRYTSPGIRGLLARTDAMARDIAREAGK